MATTTTTTNKPLNPRAQDLSPKGYNRANIFSGKALSFDGVNDYVSTALTTAASGMTTEGTISAIVKMNQLGAFEGLFGFRFSGTSEFFILLLAGGQSEARLRTTSGVYDINVNLSQYVGQYTHFVYTFGGGSVKLYANGRLIGSNTYAGTFVTSTDPASAFAVGRATFYLNGFASNAKVFNVAITPAQVSDLYLNPEKIVPDGVASSALKLWLPMMEGAGASAYDGSGNGNDGTINGATWTAGIGAPVAQTALVSWNKGTNLLRYSEDFTNAVWSTTNTTITANTTTAPNGTLTADTLTASGSGSVSHRVAQFLSTTNGASYATSIYAKKGSADWIMVRHDNGGTFNFFDLNNGVKGATCDASAKIESAGNGWYKLTIYHTTSTSSGLEAYVAISNGGNEFTASGQYIYIWGGGYRLTSDGDAYIKTNATAQTSAVLVPEGLTAGASIFGTDIITPRNAFALNLDGASWAQVGDNASLDFGSGEFSIEAWGFWSLNDNQQAIIQKGDAGIGASRGINLFRTTSNTLRVIVTANSEVTIQGAAAPISTWKHVVITKDASLLKMYVDGALYGSTSSAAGSVDVSDALRVGTFNNTQYTNGQLANPRIYNRALTAAEVLRNYNADKAKFGL